MKSPFIPWIWLISKEFSKHVFQFAPVTSTVWLQMHRISAGSCLANFSQQQDSLGNCSQKSLGPTCTSSPSCLFTPRLTVGQAMQVQDRKHWLEEALQQQSFPIHREKSCGTTSSCSILKMQYVIDNCVLKESKLNSENWRSQPDIF